MADGPTEMYEFPEGVQEDVDGLAWLGHLEKTFEYCGHEFTLRTLKVSEELYAAALAKGYHETLGQAKAWAWAHIALALVSVDGDTEFCPNIGPDLAANAKTRFKWVTERWYSHVGERLFIEYTELLARQNAAVEAIENLSQGSPPSSTPSEDSLTEVGDLDTTEIMDILES